MNAQHNINYKITFKHLDENNVIIRVDYDYNNGVKTIVIHPQQSLKDFLTTQITTKKDVEVLKYVLKHDLIHYVDVNNVVKKLLSNERILDVYYERYLKKKRHVKVTTIKTNINNITTTTTATTQHNANDTTTTSTTTIQQQNYNIQLQQLLRDLIHDINNVNVNVNNNDELYSIANYVIQRFLTFLININNNNGNVINNVVEYLKNYANDTTQ